MIQRQSGIIFIFSSLELFKGKVQQFSLSLSRQEKVAGRLFKLLLFSHVLQICGQPVIPSMQSVVVIVHELARARDSDRNSRLSRSLASIIHAGNDVEKAYTASIGVAAAALTALNTPLRGNNSEIK